MICIAGICFKKLRNTINIDEDVKKLVLCILFRETVPCVIIIVQGTYDMKNKTF